MRSRIPFSLSEANPPFLWPGQAGPTPRVRGGASFARGSREF